MGEDRLRGVEHGLADQRLVGGVEDLIAPAHATEVGGVREDAVHGGVSPAGGRSGCALGAELLGDRGCFEPVLHVEGEDAPHDRRGDGVGFEALVFGVVGVAERWPAAAPAALLGAALDAGRDAIDDGRVLELGEHAEHLEHHPPGR